MTQEKNMKTLKTITAILPMTLLLACGGGGGGYSSAPAPSIQPEPILDEVNLAKAEIDNVEIEEAGDNVAVTVNANSIKVDAFRHDSFGNWDLQPGEGGYAHGINPETGRFGILTNVDAPYGQVEYINRKIDESFNGAVYTGNTVARRANGDIEAGDVRITLKTNNSGQLKRMDFLFSGTDYDWRKKLKFGKNAQYYGNQFSTNKLKYRNGQLKGIRGDFSGPDADYITGWFGNKKIGVKIGTFGTDRDTVEFK